MDASSSRRIGHVISHHWEIFHSFALRPLLSFFESLLMAVPGFFSSTALLRNPSLINFALLLQIESNKYLLLAGHCPVANTEEGGSYFHVAPRRVFHSHRLNITSAGYCEKTFLSSPIIVWSKVEIFFAFQSEFYICCL